MALMEFDVIVDVEKCLKNGLSATTRVIKHIYANDGKETSSLIARRTRSLE